MLERRYQVIVEFMNGRTNELTVWAEDEEKAKGWALRSWGNPTIYKSIKAVDTNRKEDKMFELVIVWASGEDNTIYYYHTREEAEQAQTNMKMALGNQITWCGVRQKI